MCKECGRKLGRVRTDTKFCGAACRKRASRRRRASSPAGLREQLGKLREQLGATERQARVFRDAVRHFEREIARKEIELAGQLQAPLCL